MNSFYFTNTQLDEIVDELIEADADILNILSVLKEDDVIRTEILKKMSE